MTGVSECRQQRGNLKDNGYRLYFCHISKRLLHLLLFFIAIYLMIIKPFLIKYYTLWISSCIATARERISGSIDNYVTGVSECSQQRGSLKDDGYT
ncbi:MULTISPECIES: hypothetical protein [Photorhabdus]|uniref:hypothetical protein n=1 Tax=Photorhabdus TaxID=29487 RepID=UPI000B2CB667|nr:MULTISPECIES: hypothetical protein [Photorhabdus]NDK93825.1 hypothetical protein [Photorhabdus laumondii subsp. laumondii]NDL46824.1 hypothetical protein [Photorhabdus laumondii subsp. laumondii]